MEKIIQLNFKWGIVQQTMAVIAGGYIVTLLTFTELVLRSHVIGNMVKCWDILFIGRNYHGSPRVSGEDVSQPGRAVYSQIAGQAKHGSGVTWQVFEWLHVTSTTFLTHLPCMFLLLI